GSVRRTMETHMSRKDLKQKARAKAKQEGTSYQAALRALVPENSGFDEQMIAQLRENRRSHSFCCCGFTQVFKCEIEPGFADFADVLCVHCGRVLGTVRCDYGTPTLVRKVKGDANAGHTVMVGSDGTVAKMRGRK